MDVFSIIPIAVSLLSGGFSIAAIRRARAKGKRSPPIDDARRREITALVVHFTNLGYRVDIEFDRFKVFEPHSVSPLIDIRFALLDPATVQSDLDLPDLRKAAAARAVEEAERTKRINERNEAFVKEAQLPKTDNPFAQTSKIKRA